jgi:hypothetical protein
LASTGPINTQKAKINDLDNSLTLFMWLSCPRAYAK